MDTSQYVQVQGVSHNYGPVVALDRVSFKVAKSKVLALLGASGSGKSTLLAAIAGMITPKRGEIFVAGENLLGLATHRRSLGMVFQDYALWPHMTVKDNVGFALRGQKRSRKDIEFRVVRALERVGLERLLDRRPDQLSGGQQQRVALARAVVAEPKLLLLDEPLSALDPATRSSVRQELASLLKQLELTTILVTHDQEEAFELADHVAVLHEGKVLQIGAPNDVYERPASHRVASFMGLNLLQGKSCGNYHVALKGGISLTSAQALPSGTVSLAIIPERVSVASSPSQPNTVPARLLTCTYYGGGYRLHLSLGPDYTQHVRAFSACAPTDAQLSLHFPPEAIHLVKTIDALDATPTEVT